jgi:hypothetical protein
VDPFWGVITKWNLTYNIIMGKLIVLGEEDLCAHFEP